MNTFYNLQQDFVSYIIAVTKRWTKFVKFTLSIAVHKGGELENN